MVVSVSDPFQALDVAIADAGPAERAALVVQLAARLAALGARLGKPEADTLLTVEEACAIARVSRRRLYSWSRGKAWADRPPGTHLVRIHEAALRAWLSRKQLHQGRGVSSRHTKARARD